MINALSFFLLHTVDFCNSTEINSSLKISVKTVA